MNREHTCFQANKKTADLTTGGRCRPLPQRATNRPCCCFLMLSEWTSSLPLPLRGPSTLLTDVIVRLLCHFYFFWSQFTLVTNFVINLFSSVSFLSGFWNFYFQTHLSWDIFTPICLFLCSSYFSVVLSHPVDAPSFTTGSSDFLHR